MPLAITQRPSISYLGKTCKWNSVGNPILYKATRKDFTFNQINNSGGMVQLQFNGVDIVQEFTDGLGIFMMLYVKSDNGVYDFVAQVDTQTGVVFSGGNTLVKFVSQPYVSAAPGGFTNYASTYRLGYHVEVELWKDAAVDSLICKYNFSDYKGIITMDVSSGLRSAINKENLTNYNSFDFNGENDSAQVPFYIKYREVWSNETPPALTSDVANIFHAVHGARQIPSPNGGNLAEYTTHLDARYPAKFLTKQLISSIWKSFAEGFSNAGFVNSISLIVNDDLTSNTRLVVDSYRADNSVINLAQQVSANANKSGNLVRYCFNTNAFSSLASYLIVRLTTDGSVRAITNSTFVGTMAPWANVAPLDVDWVYAPSAQVGQTTYTELVICSGLVENSSRLQNAIAALTNGVRYQITLNFVVSDDGGVQVSVFLGAQEVNFGTFDKAGAYSERRTFVASGAHATVGIQVEFIGDITIGVLDIKVSSEIIYTEDKRINIREAACNQKHIYFRNSLGGDTFWNFDFNQTMEYNDASYNRKAKALVLFDDQLTEDDWEALNDVVTYGNQYAVSIPELLSTTIATKKRVDQQVYLFDEDGNKIGVIAIPTKNRTQTRQVRHKFEVEIELPETFI